MMRISTICALIGALAPLALSAANAEVPVPKPVTPKVTVHTPAPPNYNNPPLNHPMKQPGRTGFAPITLNRGVAADNASAANALNVAKGGKKKGTTSKWISPINEEAIVPPK